ncbi:hypothetical protein HAX54_040251 [Datura stramonium]|uniref:Glycine-rich protein n=1 Tax=Datura stramonium TaxID=4076 RepID=A0ABS8SKB0_DATST|nr:hypothetical protein [Datura stramonium]
MATKIFIVVVIMIISVVTFAYPTNARSLIAMVAKTGGDEQKEYFQHPIPPFFYGFGGLRGGIRPPFGLGALGGAFGPFVGGGGTSSFGAGTGFGSTINEGFGDNGGNNPNNEINGGLGAGDLGEGGDDAAIRNDLRP